MTTAYFECQAGISGDMTVGALIDTGVPLEWLDEQLLGLSLDGFSLSIEKDSPHGIQATRFRVATEESHHHRTFNDIKSLITKSPFSKFVKNTSLSIFDQIAAAEAKIHGVAKEKVHFHEVGAIDSIVDIVGTALCLEYLQIDVVLSSPVPLGKGYVTCQHGTLPVPVPATMEILKGVPVYGSGLNQEMVTPTGAAILKALSKEFGDFPAMSVEKIGYGVGSKKISNRPNILRVFSGHLKGEDNLNLGLPHQETVVIIETCIDDMNPEIYGYLMEKLFKDGALDVYWMPVFMKKNRPGTLVQVLCSQHSKSTLINRILSETTSTGVRCHTAQRTCLQREIVDVSSEYGTIRMKRIVDLDGNTRLVPEYEVCKEIALKHDIPIIKVYERLTRS